MMESLGWEVAKPIVPEVYDYLCRDPLNGQTARVQVKTLRIRKDRDNALVVYARKGNKEAYTKEDTDYIVGVDLEGNRAFMFECEGYSEYWSTEQSAAKRWIELVANNNIEEAV